MPLDTKKLKELAISEAGLIFDPSTGYIFTSNPVGIAIITALRDGNDKDEIKQLITEKFEANEYMIEKDTFDFFNQLIALGLISDE